MKRVRFITLFVISLVLFVSPTVSRSQTVTEPTKNCPPLELEKLSKDQLMIPGDLMGSRSIRFFQLVQITPTSFKISFLSENRESMFIVSITSSANSPNLPTTKYEIEHRGKSSEWITIRHVKDNGGNRIVATTSTGRQNELFLEELSALDEKASRRRIVRVDGVSPSQSNVSNVDSKDPETSVIESFRSFEDSLYDTDGLQDLKWVVLSLGRFQKLIAEASINTNRGLDLPEGIPDCYVACQRIGTLIPVYACTDDLLNCSRCGVDGIYYLYNYDCTVWCVLHCREFYS